MKCDVIVDSIHRIEIGTTTQELYLHNTPESLVVIAYDEYGNTFSSLEGIPFEWRIHDDAHSRSNDGHSVLRFLAWTESEYVSPKSVTVLERKGAQGFTQLVSGLRTGSAVVTASLQEPVYAAVPPAQVRLIVMANAQLSPAIAYLMPHARLDLHVHVVQQGADEEIKMPSSQYHLQVNDTSLVTLDSDDGCTITARSIGQTEVILLDRNVEEALENLGEVVRMESQSDDLLRIPKRLRPASILHVVEPAYLGFSLTKMKVITGSNLCQRAASISSTLLTSQLSQADPSSHVSNWVMEVGEQYTVTVQIYDKNGHRIHPSDNLRLQLSFPQDKLEILESTSNQTFMVIRSVSAGHAAMEAILIGHVDKDDQLVPLLQSPLRGTQDIEVYSSIQIQPSVVLLPWSSAENETSKFITGYSLSASGGSGHFAWIALSSPLDLTESQSSHLDEGQSKAVTITESGEVYASTVGEAVVVAYMPSNPLICGTARVIIGPPAAIKFIAGPSEVIVRQGLTPDSRTLAELIDENVTRSADSGILAKNQNVLTVGLAVLDALGRSRLPPRRKINADVQPSVLSECVRFRLIGLHAGSTEIEASYDPTGVKQLNLTSATESKQPDDTRSSFLLKARFFVAAYQEIVFINPSSSVTHVAVGSTRTFFVAHGPHPWPLEPSSHFVRIVSESEAQDPTKAASRSAVLPVVTREPKVIRGEVHSSNSSYSSSMHSFISPEGKSHLLTFSMRCKDSGIFNFLVQVGNRPTLSNPVPILMSSKFTMKCDIPTSLRLLLHQSVPTVFGDASPCPSTPNVSDTEISDEAIVPNTVPSLVSLVISGSDGRELEAVDSLTLSVLLVHNDPTSLAGSDLRSKLVLDASPPVQFPTDTMQSSSPHPYRPYFIFHPSEPGVSSGRLMVHASAKAHASFFSKSFNMPDLFADLPIRFADPVQISPMGRLRLFNHPKAELYISLVGGSGHFHLTSTSPSSTSGGMLTIREVDSPASNREYKTIRRVYRVLGQHIGQSIIHVVDACFPALPTTAQSFTPTAIQPYEVRIPVDVVGLGSLHLQVADRIQLGNEVTAIINAVDTGGVILPLNATRHLHLTIHQDSYGILEVSNMGPSSNIQWTVDPTSGLGVAQFKVRGLNLGSSSLAISTKLDGRTVRSNTVELQVFAPLSLSPCNFNLLLGAEYELHTNGGPQPAVVNFRVVSKHPSLTSLTILKTTTNGVLVRATGTPGVAELHAHSIGLSLPSNGSELSSQSLTTSETTCSISVVRLSGIRIGCPLASSKEVSLHAPISTTSSPTLNNNLDSNDDRFMVACGSDQDTGCGNVPLWAEGIAFSDLPKESEFSTKGDLSHEPLFVTPLAMAGVVPPLRFTWRLSPPEPNSVARLRYHLDGFNVEPREIHTASGMSLVGLSPGHVTVHLMVESTESDAGQLFGGHRIQRFQASLNLVILPHLSLPAPLPEARQLLMSPNSQFQLKPNDNSIFDSYTQYSLLNGSPNQSNVNSAVSIDSNGIIHTNALCSHGSNAPDCHSVIRITSWPKEQTKSSDKKGNELVTQTALVDVIVKPPRYVSTRPATPSFEFYVHSLGLPVGGPYNQEISYHDELGRRFDAVADDYFRIGLHLHRTDLLEVKLHSNAANNLPRSTEASRQGSKRTALRSVQASTLLSIRVLPVPLEESDDSLLGYGLRSDSVAVLRMVSLRNELDLRPIYLSMPYGGELEAMRLPPLVVSEWTCLPKLTEKGQWSSSNPSIMWVDPVNRFLLARREGKAYLMYKVGVPADNPKSSSNASGSNEFTLDPLTYLSNIIVSPLLSQVNSVSVGTRARLVPVDLDNNALQPDPAVLPILSNGPTTLSSGSTVLRFLIQLTGFEGKTDDTSCSIRSEQSRHILPSIAPIDCVARLQSGDKSSNFTTYQSNSLPSWLNFLILWNHNETIQSMLETESPTLPLEQLVTASLELLSPLSSFYKAAVRWQCSVRLSPSWQQWIDLIGLILEPQTRIVLELTHSPGPQKASEVLARSEILPLPGFQVIIPSSLPIDSEAAISVAQNPVYFLWVSNAKQVLHRFLIFLPPSTAKALSSGVLGPDRLVARSKSPGILEIPSPPRPIYSLVEVTQLLSEYVSTLSSAQAAATFSHLPQSTRKAIALWRSIAMEQIQSIENEEAITSNGHVVKENLLWVVDLKANPGSAAIDTVVDVVISLRQTGAQHVTVSVHVQMPSITQLMGTAEDDSNTKYPAVGFSWIHLLALLLITLLIAIVIHVLFRSAILVSTSTGTGKLPPVVSPSGNGPLRTSPRQLWSQGYSVSPGKPPIQSIRPAMSFSLDGQRKLPPNVSPPRYRRSDIPVAEREEELTLEEQRWRRALSGGSPSRLRDTFDSI
ncbi:unnamed protein product [Calicophoron daubneyi]|uniref:Nuclear pore membrane glycoprotein 210 n=1 Tax=Calicophoron daubneyi TaxID=300641 RepID=A0AAV2TTZ3_CALDB